LGGPGGFRRGVGGAGRADGVYRIATDTANVIWLPFFLLLAMATALGFGLWLAALNVRYRDVNYLVPFLVQIWMYLTPVIYSVTLIPEQYRWLLALNPMTGVVEGFRWALLGGVDGDGAARRALCRAIPASATLLVITPETVRQIIQEACRSSLRHTTEQEIPSSLYGQIHELDNMFWAQRETFLMVIGERELRNARQRQHSSRSHWWWYLDELRMLPQPKNTERDWLTQAMIPA
jgi:hypothetical protein